MHINYDVEISVDRVMSIFAKKPRALEFSNIYSKQILSRFRMLLICLFLYQKQPLRVVLEKRCSETYNQISWTRHMKKLIFSKFAG